MCNEGKYRLFVYVQIIQQPASAPIFTSIPAGDSQKTPLPPPHRLLCTSKEMISSIESGLTQSGHSDTRRGFDLVVITVQL